MPFLPYCQELPKTFDEKKYSVVLISIAIVCTIWLRGVQLTVPKCYTFGSIYLKRVQNLPFGTAQNIYRK